MPLLTHYRLRLLIFNCFSGCWLRLIWFLRTTSRRVHSASCGLRKSWKWRHGKHPHWGDGQQQDSVACSRAHFLMWSEAERGTEKDGKGEIAPGSLMWLCNCKQQEGCGLLADLYFITSWQYQLKWTALQRGHRMPSLHPPRAECTQGLKRFACWGYRVVPVWQSTRCDAAVHARAWFILISRSLCKQGKPYQEWSFLSDAIALSPGLNLINCISQGFYFLITWFSVLGQIC